jgi:hypothetical protein
VSQPVVTFDLDGWEGPLDATITRTIPELRSAGAEGDEAQAIPVGGGRRAFIAGLADDLQVEPGGTDCGSTEERDMDGERDASGGPGSGEATERFQALLERGSRELFEDNRDKMSRGELLQTPNVVAAPDVELFLTGVDAGLIELERGAKFNTQDRPKAGGRWSLLSRSEQGGWYNAEYLPQLAAYVDAIVRLGYPSERVLFELPAAALQLDLAILDDDANVVVLGEAKRDVAMLDALLNEGRERFTDIPPGPETKKRGDEVRQLAWRLWTVRPPLLWLIGPDSRRAFACSYDPLRLIEVGELPDAPAAGLGHAPPARLEPPQLATS